MRALVCGGRNFTDAALLYVTLDQLYMELPITLVIHGAARGADRLAGQWASERGVLCSEHPADWQLHGKAAGPIRNSAMLAERPDLVVAFPGGAGTADMIRKAEAAGIRVEKISC